MNRKSKEEKVVRKRQKVKKSAKRSRRLALTLVVIVATAIIATGAVVTRQRIKVNEESKNRAGKAPATASANRNYVTVRVAGQDVQVDGQTGQIKSLSPEEAQKVAEGLKQVINRSTEGLVETREADGSVSVDLQDRFQNVAVARKNDDGSVEQGCVDNAQAAGELFGIDPQLIDANQPSRGDAGKKQPRVTTQRN
jgi:cytoskeletal protein RodZ